MKKLIIILFILFYFQGMCESLPTNWARFFGINIKGLIYQQDTIYVDSLVTLSELNEQGFLKIESDPKYIADSSSIKSSIRDFANDSSTWNDVILKVPYTGATQDVNLATNSITATTGKFTNLTDRFIPYHISDASGLENSGLKWESNSNLTLTQNSVVSFTSENTGAVANTLYLKGGSVGIGTATPTERLEVSNGSFKISDTNNTVRQFSIERNSVNIGGFNTNNSQFTVFAASGKRIDFQANNNTINSHLTIATTGNIGIGTTVPPSKLSVAETSTSSVRGITNWQVSNTDDAARMIFMKDRGTTVGTPATVTSGTKVAMIMAKPYDGTDYRESAYIEMGTSGTIGTNRVPSYIALGTSTDAAPSVLTQRLMIDNAGLIIIPNGGKIASKKSDNTTTSVLMGFNAGSDYPTFGDPNLAGFTMNMAAGYGVRPHVDNSFNLGSLSLRWKDIYSSGTSYLTTVGIGTTAPAARLDVNGAVKIGNDATAASSTNAGAIRYRVYGTTSYCEMVMQTGASTYEWVVIKSNTW